MQTRAGKTETVTISLPRAMRKTLDELRAREHRTTSELFREALRVYATTRATYTPTAAERRAITEGRVSESLTLEEARTYVDRLDAKSRAQKPRPRARKRA
jgi:metal-responsive CopG/Arc/MetJ family transcriptional regulator